MDKFKKIEISDKTWVNEILKKSPRKTIEYSFTTLFIWSDIYNTKIREYEGTLIIRFGSDERAFAFPAGDKNIKKAIDWILENNKENEFRFAGLSEEQKEFLEKNYPDKFEFTENRDLFEYVYLKENLETLSGRKLSSKRNHINRFTENNPDWMYEPITEENIADVDKMHDEWMEKADTDKKSGLISEAKAVKKAIKYFNELDLVGGVIKLGRKIIAFSMGGELNEKTFHVNIEKAFSDIQGAYPMINKQFVINAAGGYEFIDREEDTGDEGLRKAKLSYYPYELVKKYCATVKE